MWVSPDYGKVLAGKVALITGGGRGIGKAIGLAYGKAGAAVCLTQRSTKGLGAAVGEFKALEVNACGFPCDVRNIESVESLFRNAEKFFKGIDIVVINAGLNLERSCVEDTHPENWKNVLETNLLGAYYCARTAIPYLKKRGGGKILTMGSGRGHRGDANNSSYCCSKAGLWMLTRILAQELWQDNITVNEIIPGPVASKMNEKLLQSGNFDTVFTDKNEWVKEPEDLVQLAMLLATAPDRGPTGQSFSLARREVLL